MPSLEVSGQLAGSALKWIGAAPLHSQADLGRAARKAGGRGGVDGEALGQVDHSVFEVGGGEAFGVFASTRVGVVLGHLDVDVQARGRVGDVGGRPGFEFRFEFKLVAAGHGGEAGAGEHAVAEERVLPGVAGQGDRQRALSQAVGIVRKGWGCTMPLGQPV